MKELSPKNRINYYNSFESLGFKIEKIYEDNDNLDDNNNLILNNLSQENNNNEIGNYY